jgi:hypothetical protein
VIGVALTAMLTLVSACGGSSSSDQTATFKKSFSSVANGFRADSQAIGTAIQQAPSRTDTELANTFRNLAQRWQTQVSRLEALKPPASVAGAFTKMTGATQRAESDLNAVATAVGGHNAGAARTAARSLVTDIVAAKSDSQTITSKLGIK